MNLKPTEAAYIAGLFDGEGSVGLYVIQRFRTGMPRLRIQLGMNDERPLRMIEDCYPGALVSSYFNKWGRTWKAQVAKRDLAIQFLNDIRPYSIAKGEQIDLALEFLALPAGRGIKQPPEIITRAKEIGESLKALKLRGAELSI